MADFKMSITPTTVVDLSEGQILDLNRSLGRLSSGLPMLNFKVMQLPSGKYKYQFDTVDGRHWEQNLEILSDLVHNFHCDFNKIEGDQWSEAEFAPHRELRKNVVKLIRLGMTKLIVTWEV